MNLDNFCACFQQAGLCQTCSETTVTLLAFPRSTTMVSMLKTMQKNCLSSQSCKFIKNYFSKIIFVHAHVQCVCIVMSKCQMAPAETVVGVDRPV